ncbi:MAG: cell wall metabolism sensor histidine kinase WalK [Clostridiales bacterium]|jgi:two-component system sensor histidine kinase VicK|nr:cell wall metabolism sensor histidine kinase WalK [Clostridiales bacterium]
MNSIKLKLLFICIAVMLIVMSVCGSIMLQTVKANEEQKSREQLRAYAVRINEQIVQVYESPAQFQDGFDRWNTDNEIQGGIMDAAGVFVAPYSFLGHQINNSAVVAALAGREDFLPGEKGLDFNLTEQEWLCYTLPAEKNGERFVVFTRMNAQAMNKNLSQLTLTFIIMVVIALVLTGALWYVFADTLTRPIIALTRRAKEMAEGNLDTDIPVQSRDEIGQLTESFNNMAKELNTTLANISSETNKRGAILHNMTDGVLAYDAGEKLIHANNTSGELLGYDDIQTAPMREILKRLYLSPEEVYALAQDQVKESTLSIGDRFITACVTPYMNLYNEIDGYVIVLQDVTKMTKLDLMRKDFVANVSHELRTPLTSVQTYTETLLDGAIDDRKTAIDFLKVIDGETQRMALLVTDLLSLSRLDNKSSAEEKEVIDLAGLLRVAVRQSQVHADKKGQRITFDSPNKPYFIEANAARINQVVTNILTNSVKYSPEDTEIDVSTEETDKYYRVFIRDHGMGIPKDDIPHIFERFYRVDKARSRAMGGTGLGLAIAKEIMEEHGGRIIVTSELNQGTTMVLRFTRYKSV